MRFPALFRDASIRRKFIFIAFFSTGMTMLVVILLSTVMQWFMLRAELERSLSVQASIIAQNSAIGLISNDRKTVEKTVHSLAIIDNIEFAGILDKSGNDFALYVRPGFMMPRHQHEALNVEFHLKTIKYIEVLTPIISGHERLGWVHVRSDLLPMYMSLSLNLLLDIAATAAACGVALLILFGLLPAITNPLQSLVQLANGVSLDNDFSLRAESHSKDEIGTLANGFNAMLARIQERDTALLQHEPPGISWTVG